jgi:broad specificity phosphatase PhoE
MLELLIARHGDTAWNAGDVFRGRVPIPLSETGKNQARRLGDFLSKKKIEAIYCSPLERAVQTAEAVAKKQNLTALPMNEFTDLDFGEWEGLPVQEVKTRYKDIYENWVRSPDVTQVPGGESLNDASIRVKKGLESVISRHKEGCTAVVTHRVITKILVCSLLGLDNSHFWNVDIDTCGLTTFHYTGKIFILKHHNDISFLSD